MTAAPPVMTTSPAATLSFPMQGVGAAGSKVAGTVTIQRDGDDAFTITVDLTGLAPGSSHVWHIHNGTCGINGSIAVPLPDNVVADGTGHALVSDRVAAPYKGDGWYANVHTGPDLTTPQNAAPIACGDLASAPMGTR
jgi:hypothetical protein